ncbi:hypothetical protein PGH12_12585 [Chryseobacterium wangxinyae]|uniref:hypothetical protein n=1 Tax=Chryseobacterium sp. CY350 TaxID=2997336 RepID=UPI00226DBD60|nr:hypothetical protein [Chryseobacterium sp. CY350]MCY0976094.1 hypothetical protein [Chryseobacterium sp. CY350]WBZ94306.1 hypothetical protein PGH12_12585 [Chryseobacterium sp. CY350]
MTTKIKIIEVFNLSNKIFFNVKIEGDKYLIGDIYQNSENDLAFILKGVGIENNPDSETKSLLVEILNENYSLKDFKDKIFISKV